MVFVSPRTEGFIRSRAALRKWDARLRCFVLVLVLERGRDGRAGWPEVARPREALELGTSELVALALEALEWRTPATTVRGADGESKDRAGEPARISGSRSRAGDNPGWGSSAGQARKKR